MKATLFILLSMFMLLSCKSNPEGTIKGNGKIISDEVNIGDYRHINVSASCDIVYEQKINQKPYLRIEADENLRNRIMINSRNGNLSISTKGAAGKFRIYTNSTSLSRIKFSGSGTLTLKGEINSPDLDISISGSGNIKADKINCPNTGLSVSGSGSVYLSGNSYNCDYKISGSGSIDAYKLKATKVSCRLSGSGNAKVYASESLDVRVSGSGGVSYKGSPQNINKTLSGSGWLKPQ